MLHLRILAGARFRYSFVIPSKCPGGTLWHSKLEDTVCQTLHNLAVTTVRVYVVQADALYRKWGCRLGYYSGYTAMFALAQAQAQGQGPSTCGSTRLPFTKLSNKSHWSRRFSATGQHLSHLSLIVVELVSHALLRINHTQPLKSALSNDSPQLGLP